MLTPENRELIHIAAECLTAVGTLLAVIVALYLSRADERRNLRQRKTALRAFAMQWKARIDHSGKFHEIANGFEEQRQIFIGLTTDIDHMVGFFKRNALRGAVKAITTMTAGRVDTITTDNITGEKELTGNQNLAGALAHFIELLS